MPRLSTSNTVRAALFAVAAFGASSLATTTPASARHFHGLGLSIHLGDGYSSFRVGPSCRYYYRKWINTGDAYWWDRYDVCRSSY